MMYPDIGKRYEGEQDILINIETKKTNANFEKLKEKT